MKFSSFVPYCLLWALVLPGSAFSLSSDRNQPIEIEANTLEIDDHKGIAIYRGNVHLTQGSMRLDAQELTVYGLRDPEKILAKGNPARFRQRPDGKEEDVHAEALRMEYRIQSNKVLLYEKAKITHEANVFQSHRIEYDANGAKVKAGEKSSGSERVRVILQPMKRKPDDSNP